MDSFFTLIKLIYSYKLRCFLHIIIIYLCLSFKGDNHISSDNNNYEVYHCLNCSKNSEALQEHLPYDDLKIIKLETTSDCLLTWARQLAMNDSLIFFLDMMEGLYIFNMEGKFITQVGQKGQGPADYLQLNSFFVDDKNSRIAIIDDYKDMFIFYDFAGKYISSTKKPQGSSIRSNKGLLTDDNHLLIHHAINMRTEDNMAFSIIDMNTGKLKGKYFTYNPIKLSNYVDNFSSRPTIKIGDEIHFIMPFCDTIYSYSKSSFSPKYIIKTFDKVAKKQQIEYNTRNLSAEINRLQGQGYFTGFTGIFETENKIILEYREFAVMGFFIFDKNTKTGHRYLYTHNVGFKEVPFFNIVHSLPNDRFVGMTTPEGLLLDIEKSKGNNKYLLQLKKILKDSEEDDNPILFIYGFNIKAKENE